MGYENKPLSLLQALTCPIREKYPKELSRRTICTNKVELQPAISSMVLSWRSAMVLDTRKLQAASLSAPQETQTPFPGISRVHSALFLFFPPLFHSLIFTFCVSFVRTAKDIHIASSHNTKEGRQRKPEMYLTVGAVKVFEK